MSVKYIFITGGVVSSLGKGLTAASIGMLLEKCGHKIAVLKLDPYLNVDPGTMNPFEHGEVYVTDDGAETDLDLGHYYRYTNSPLSRASNATSGQLYDTVIKRERKGEYSGKTVQVIPHVTNEIQNRILACANQDKDIDIVLVEIGGTAGDIESLPFLEAIRQFCYERKKDCINLHLAYVPYLKAAGELKTKPTQHSAGVLRSIGIFPEILLCRCERPLPQEIKEKLSLFCNVPEEAVFDEPDVIETIYEVPLGLHNQGLDFMICQKLNIAYGKPDLSDWEKMIHTVTHPKGKVTVGIVGKYLDHQDAYKSVFESLRHGAAANGVEIEIRKYESDKIFKEGSVDKTIEGCDGYLVPGGFGERGWEGKIQAARFARENNIPYFGICLGMQVMVVEFARHVLGLKDADSTEMNRNTPYPVVALLSEQKSVDKLGGSMRLGTYPCRIQKGTLAERAYGDSLVFERHRHRYEVNNEFKAAIEKKGMIFSGIHEKGTLCEVAEVKNHPWMLGVQSHPEFKSKPLKPHPLFKDFVAAMIINARQREGKKALK